MKVCKPAAAAEASVAELAADARPKPKPKVNSKAEAKAKAALKHPDAREKGPHEKEDEAEVEVSTKGTVLSGVKTTWKLQGGRWVSNVTEKVPPTPSRSALKGSSALDPEKLKSVRFEDDPEALSLATYSADLKEKIRRDGGLIAKASPPIHPNPEGRHASK